ncbi:Os02g0601750, partial [Oryza sativa Japonica Group]
MQHGGSTEVEILRHVGAALDELPQHLHAAAPRGGVDRPAHHLQPEHRGAATATAARAFPAVGAIRRAPRRHGVVQQQPEHLGVPAPRGGVEHVRDAVLALAEHQQGVPLHELLHERHVPRRRRRVEQPPAVPRPEQRVLGGGGGAPVLAALALQQEAPGDARAVPRRAGEARVVVPERLEPADPAERGELDEEVRVEVQQLPDDVVVAVRRRPVDRRRVPPLVAGALPPQREV